MTQYPDPSQSTPVPGPPPSALPNATSYQPSSNYQGSGLPPLMDPNPYGVGPSASFHQEAPARAQLIDAIPYGVGPSSSFHQEAPALPPQAIPGSPFYQEVPPLPSPTVPMASFQPEPQVLVSQAAPTASFHQPAPQPAAAQPPPTPAAAYALPAQPPQPQAVPAQPPYTYPDGSTSGVIGPHTEPIPNLADPVPPVPAAAYQVAGASAYQATPAATYQPVAYPPTTQVATAASPKAASIFDNLPVWTRLLRWVGLIGCAIAVVGGLLGFIWVLTNTASMGGFSRFYISLVCLFSGCLIGAVLLSGAMVVANISQDLSALRSQDSPRREAG